jgi:hypothetical protein
MDIIKGLLGEVNTRSQSILDKIDMRIHQPW